MIVELDINNNYILVRFSKDELSRLLQKAYDTGRTIKDILDEVVRVGFNQVLEQV